MGETDDRAFDERARLQQIHYGVRAVTAGRPSLLDAGGPAGRGFEPRVPLKAAYLHRAPMR